LEIILPPETALDVEISVISVVVKIAAAI